MSNNRKKMRTSQMQKLIRELIMEEDLDISSAEDENNGEE